MAEAPDSGGDRTEAPTPRRLERARQEGQVAISHELPALLSLTAAVLTFALLGPAWLRTLALQLSVPLRRFDLSDVAALRFVILAGARTAAPLVLATLLAGAAGVLLQTGFLLSLAPLRPAWSRISSAAGLRRLLSVTSVIDAGKSLAKVGVMGAATWRAVRSDLPLLAEAPYRDPRLLLGTAMHIALHITVAVLLVQAAIAAFDILWTRFRRTQELRMSRQDLRDEQKETEGDPAVKGRIRQLRLHRARRRMLAAVPKAAVVVTNPTHYAVALVYDRGRNMAPRVVAKGVDAMAARIREVAAAHRVPLVANPPLARALYRLELDSEIPPEHYRAVAEIIAYVWGLGSRTSGAAAA